MERRKKGPVGALERYGSSYARPGAGLEATGASMEKIQTYAEQVAKVLGITPKANLAQIVRSLGGKIRVADLDLAVHTGSIYVHGRGDFDVVIPEDLPPTRERFTIAHELGHYLLHSRLGQVPLVAPRLPPRHGKHTDRLEWEANWFAAALLMPRVEFLRAVARYGNKIRAIAADFGVSTQAALIRRAALQSKP